MKNPAPRGLPAAAAADMISVVPATPLLAWLERRALAFHVALTFALLGLVGLADYLSGYNLSILIFYLLPISLALWFVGHRFALCICFLSIAVWLAGDLAAGAVYPSKFILGWNAAIALAFFLVVVWLLHHLRVAMRGLERRVLERTTALRAELTERARLEDELLAVAERERHRLGHDLHDGLGQHLTATAMAGQVLSEALAARALRAESAAAGRLVALIEEAIGQTRELARDLVPAGLEAEGLATALRELAASTVRRHPGVVCTFVGWPEEPTINDPTVAEHLFRIAQESVRNALRHGGARHIEIRLRAEAGGAGVLTVEDDGCGLLESGSDPRLRASGGLGLRLMAHRAAILNSRLDARRLGPKGGTRVTCRFPLHGEKSTVETQP
ncbi:MAG: sensor histidine kinase [Verrucomicrobia bacterium]|nr:sensor histidine kinase [Verrucomicrobiota bacterium]